MVNFKVLLVAVCLLSSPLVFGGEFFANTEGLSRIHRLNPCSSWRYMNFNTGSGYLCTFKGMSISVPDAYDVDRLFRNLQTKIDRLEARVTQLEGQK